MKLVALLVFYRVHWGVSSRAPWGSIVQPSYTLPPPTTIIGALARAFYSLKTISTKEFVEENGNTVLSAAYNFIKEMNVKWVTAAWLSPIIKTGISIAYFAAPYRATFDTAGVIIYRRQPPRQLFSFQELGYIVAPHAILAITLLLESSDRKEDHLLHKVLDSAVFVSRVGSKESFVDPLYAGIFEVEELKSKNGVRTAWLTPSDCLDEVQGNFNCEKTPIPYTIEEWLCWYSTKSCSNITKLDVMREAVHPRYPGWVKVSIKTEKCKLLYVGKGIYSMRLTYNKLFLENMPPPLRNIIVPSIETR